MPRGAIFRDTVLAEMYVNMFACPPKKLVKVVHFAPLQASILYAYNCIRRSSESSSHDTRVR